MIRFIQSKNNNMKYAGLYGAEKLLLVRDINNTNFDIEQHDTTKVSQMEKIPDELQNGVMICLESSDPVVRQKALCLLPLMASTQNVRNICDKIIGQIRLQKVEDSFGRKDLIEKVLGMAERFFLRAIQGIDSDESGVSFDWYVFVLVRLLQAAHGEQREMILSKIKCVLLKNKEKKTNKDEEATNSIHPKFGIDEAIKVRTKLTN